MKILVVGNGFDLAHGLPTKYTDFLEYCRMVKYLYKRHLTDRDLLRISGGGWYKYPRKYQRLRYPDADSEMLRLHTAFEAGHKRGETAAWRRLRIRVSGREECFRVKFKSLYLKRGLVDREELKELFHPRRVGIAGFQPELLREIYPNIWVDYFTKRAGEIAGNWVDFEREIGEVIKSLDGDIRRMGEDGREKAFETQVRRLSHQYLKRQAGSLRRRWRKGKKSRRERNFTYRALRDILLEDLEKLKKAFNFYLYDFVDSIPVQGELPDIRDHVFDGVLSFNYTETYRRYYDGEEFASYEYIHGKAGKDGRLVLGMDEYLPADQRSRELEFMAFKKYAQRGYCGTQKHYFEWLEEIRAPWKTDIWEYIRETDGKNKGHLDRQRVDCHRLYIFGHSLDKTDGDVLLDFIMNDSVRTVIYYWSEDAMKQQTANLVRIIGQEAYVRKIRDKTLTFVPQRPADVRKAAPQRRRADYDF